MIELSEVREPNSDTILENSSVQEQDTQVFVPWWSNKIFVHLERYVGHMQKQRLVDNDPQTYQEVVQSGDSDKWQEAMRIEIKFMYSNKIWNLVDSP